MPVAQPWRASTMFPGLVAALDAQATAVQLLPAREPVIVTNLLAARAVRHALFTAPILLTSYLNVLQSLNPLNITTPPSKGSPLPTRWTPPNRRPDITTHRILVRSRWNNKLPSLLNPTESGMPIVLVQNTSSLFTTYRPCFLESRVTALFPPMFTVRNLVLTWHILPRALVQAAGPKPSFAPLNRNAPPGHNPIDLLNKLINAPPTNAATKITLSVKTAKGECRSKRKYSP